MQQWSILFWIGSGIYLFGSLVFILLVDSKPESWGQQRKSQSNALKSNHQHSEKQSKQIESRISESNLLSNTTTSSSYSSSSSSSSSSSASSTSESINSTIVIVEPYSNHGQRSPINDKNYTKNC